jgi:GTPase SAR1 family protein
VKLKMSLQDPLLVGKTNFAMRGIQHLGMRMRMPKGCFRLSQRQIGDNVNNININININLFTKDSIRFALGETNTKLKYENDLSKKQPPPPPDIFYLDLSPFDTIESQEMPLKENFGDSVGVKFDFKNITPSLKEMLKENAIAVAVVGRYSSGKTTFLKQMLPQVNAANSTVGVGPTTTGIPFYGYTHSSGKKFIVLDTEGFDSPMGVDYSDDLIQQKLCREFMTAGIVRDVVDFTIYVTQQYTLRDELNVGLLSKSDTQKRVIVVHNPHHCRTSEEVKAYMSLLNHRATLSLKSVSDLNMISEKLTSIFTNDPKKEIVGATHLYLMGVEHYFIFNNAIRDLHSWNKAQIDQITEMISHQSPPKVKDFYSSLSHSFFANFQNLLHNRFSDGAFTFSKQDPQSADPAFYLAAPTKSTHLRIAKVIASTSPLSGSIKGDIFWNDGCREYVLECPCHPDHLIITYSHIPKPNIHIHYDFPNDKTLQRKKFEPVDSTLVSMMRSTAEMFIYSLESESLDSALAWVQYGRLHIFIPRPVEKHKATKLERKMKRKLEKTSDCKLLVIRDAPTDSDGEEDDDE